MSTSSGISKSGLAPNSEAGQAAGSFLRARSSFVSYGLISAVILVSGCGGEITPNSRGGGGYGDPTLGADADGDGIADNQAIDLDGDGVIDGIDIDGDGIIDGVGIDTDGDGVIDGVDTTGDGNIDQNAPATADVTDGTDVTNVADDTTDDDMVNTPDADDDAVVDDLNNGSGEPGPEPPITLDEDDLAAACDDLGGELNMGTTKLRRLTHAQLNNSIRDLFNVTGDPAGLIAGDGRVGPFENNAFLTANELVVEQIQEAAAAVATSALPNMATSTPCDLTADEGTTCATQFVEALLLKAYRRPATADEVAEYVSLYSVGYGYGGAENGFRLVVEAVIQAPTFLYQWYVGDTAEPVNGVVPVTPYELASRLSFFLWNSLPDDALQALAADGTLTQESVIQAQLDRMLVDVKAASTIPQFHMQWLKLQDLPGKEKDTSRYPTFDATLAAAMYTETGAFADNVIRQGDGLLSSLFTADYSVIDGPLFDLYGVAKPADFVAGSTTQMPAGQRSGVLTQAAFLTQWSHRDQTSPVHRGIVIRENIMCQLIPPAPSDITIVIPEPSEATTTRERFAAHTEVPSCAACHKQMDPLGLAFENYDPVGAYRTMDGVNAVDSTVEISESVSDMSGAYANGVELSAALAQSETVRDCVGNQWFRFALGRMESELDSCTIQTLRQGLAESGGNIRLLLSQIALSDAFRNVRATAE